MHTEYNNTALVYWKSFSFSNLLAWKFKFAFYVRTAPMSIDRYIIQIFMRRNEHSWCLPWHNRPYVNESSATIHWWTRAVWKTSSWGTYYGRVRSFCVTYFCMREVSVRLTRILNVWDVTGSMVDIPISCLRQSFMTSSGSVRCSCMSGST